MRQSSERNESTWGAQFNAEWRQVVGGCPDWARPRHREKWSERGLVVWDDQTEQCTWLSPTPTLHLLKQLRTTDAWREHGLIIGEPAIQFWLNEPEREAEKCLMDEMSVRPDQLQVILELLERHEERLQQLSEEQEKDRRRRVSKAYDVILNFGRERRIEEQSREADIGE